MARAARPRRSPIREAESSIRGEMARGAGPRSTSVSSGRLPFAKPTTPTQTVPTATRHPEPRPEHEREAPASAVHVDRGAPAEPSRTLPRRRGEIPEQPTANPRSKLAELRSKIAVLQDQLALARAGSPIQGASEGPNAEAIADALVYIDAAITALTALDDRGPGNADAWGAKARASVLRMLERAKEALS